jgi:hypothetical protein
LVNDDVADAVGEVCYFCELRHATYVSQFSVYVDTRWNLYTQCRCLCSGVSITLIIISNSIGTGGSCNFYEPYGNLAQSFGNRQGVGRETCLGRNVHDGLGLGK